MKTNQNAGSAYGGINVNYKKVAPDNETCATGIQ